MSELYSELYSNRKIYQPHINVQQYHFTGINLKKKSVSNASQQSYNNLLNRILSPNNSVMMDIIEKQFQDEIIRFVGLKEEEKLIWYENNIEFILFLVNLMKHSET